MQCGETPSIGKPEVGQTCSVVTPPARQAAGFTVHHASCSVVLERKAPETPVNGLTRPFVLSSAFILRPFDVSVIAFSYELFLLQ